MQASDKIFDINSMLTENAPYKYSYQRFDDSVKFFDLVFNEETSVSEVHECISIGSNFHVC